jgi:cytochrome c biogenesis protein CcdA
MLGAISDTLPLGIGIAMNPIAIVAGILILASASARSSSVAFTAGWVLGLTLLLVLALLVQQQVSTHPDTPRDFVSFLKVVLGVVLLGGAVRLIFFPRKADGDTPKWMRFVDQIGSPRAAGLGLFLSIVSLKNIALILGAAALIRDASLATQGLVLTLVVFLLICTIGILMPLVVHLSGGARADARLARWRSWLLLNVNLITAIVMALLGLLMIGHGVTALA